MSGHAIDAAELSPLAAAAPTADESSLPATEASMASIRPPEAVLDEPRLPATSLTAISTSSSSINSITNGPAVTNSPSTTLKRPAPSLLPPFEPLSSSPALPRPTKRQNTGAAHLKYPTPVPTSSTGILSSPSPRRSVLVRAPSERAPLSAVPTIELPENGEVIAMGRSSNSSQFQLSANRLVSRVHVEARYIPASQPADANRVEIVCTGWNGLKLHCQGRTWGLFKGDSFTSETEGTDIMVDVLDARVMVQWPKRVTMDGRETAAALSDSSWDNSPPGSRIRSNSIPQSSLRRSTLIQSPVSPTPAGLSGVSQRVKSMLPCDQDEAQDQGIHIFEDEPEFSNPTEKSHVNINSSMRTDATESLSSELSDLEDDSDNSHDDPDEENDPIIHSFGPFGADISSRLASITAVSPEASKSASPKSRNSNWQSSPAFTSDCKPDLEKLSHPVSSLPVSCTGSCPPPEEEDTAPGLVESECKIDTSHLCTDLDPAVVNHVVNQLAFSRLSSTPLSIIMQNLPSESKVGLNASMLRDAIEATPCIGIIKRQGKDAAGKPLESEYYYEAERDDDQQRRAAVVDGLRKPSLRSCRKQHKVFYSELLKRH